MEIIRKGGVFFVLCLSFVRLSCLFFGTYLTLVFDVVDVKNKALYVSKTL